MSKCKPLQIMCYRIYVKNGENFEDIKIFILLGTNKGISYLNETFVKSHKQITRDFCSLHTRLKLHHKCFYCYRCIFYEGLLK